MCIALISFNDNTYVSNICIRQHTCLVYSYIKQFCCVVSFFGARVVGHERELLPEGHGSCREGLAPALAERLGGGKQK